jgi:predicted DNA-binding protein (MmcQ/YjbR family)
LLFTTITARVNKLLRINIEDIRDYCLQKKGAEECFPFDQDTIVFKVAGKLFLLASINSNPLTFNVKCEPLKALELREIYHFVLPGYHMNKTHWNTIICNEKAHRKLLLGFIDDSYNLVLHSLSKKTKRNFLLD